MVAKKSAKRRKSGTDVDNSKLNPEKSVGKSLLARLQEFKEKKKEAAKD